MAEKKLNFKPLGLNILVLPEKAETATKSGVILVQKEEERPQSGTVVAVGTGMKDPNGNVIAPILKVGDKVLFKKNAYNISDVELDNEKYLIMNEGDIIGVFEK